MKLLNRMEILFWRHSTSAQKRNGTSTIYLRITVDGSREDIGSTGIRIHSDTWCDQSQRISHQDPNGCFKNEQLALVETKLWAINNELLRKSQSVTADRIKRMFIRPEAVTYLTAFDMFQKEFEKNQQIALSTKAKLKTIKQSIVGYLADNRLRDILLDEFDGDVLDGYRSWSEGLGQKESYILRNMRGVKRITAFAKSKRLIDLDPLDDYKIGREKIPVPKYVNSHQLAAWLKHRFNSGATQKAADLFVLYARTGFHYQDLIQVIRNPQEYIMTGIDGKQWILKPRQKTEVEAKIPIHRFPEIQKIVNKYGGWDKIPVYSNAKLNDWLKLCVVDINMRLDPEHQIYSELSVKHGRCSFCDYCLNELGLVKQAILTMIGRLTDSELERYVRGDERGVVTAFDLHDAAMAS